MPQGERTSLDTLTGGEQSGTFTGAAVDLIIGRLDQMAAEQRKPVRPRVPWEACHPIQIGNQIPLVAGAGTLNLGNVFGPELPYWWDLRTISVWGFTAGTVSVFLNSTSGSGELLGSTTVPGQFTWGAQEMLGPQDNVIWTATGVTGVVNVSLRAVEVQAAWLPEYLM